MPKQSAKGRDFAVNAFRVVEKAIGEHMDGTPLENPDAGKNPAAVALGKLGGAKGGAARVTKLSSDQRKSIATKAADVRWAAKSGGKVSGWLFIYTPYYFFRHAPFPDY